MRCSTMTIDLKEQLRKIVLKHNNKSTIALVMADEEHALNSISNIRKEGMADALLIGNKGKIKELLEKLGDNISNYEVIDESDMGEASKKAIDSIREGRTNVLMKGLIDSSILLKIMLTYGRDLSPKRLISHLALVSIPNMDKLCFITDCGVNILPSLEEKKSIIENAVSYAKSLDFDNLKVACLCAKEKPYEKMPATMDALALQQMSLDGTIADCLISGPLAFDNIISKEAARIKGVTDPLAGNTDIILVPNIETGNAMLKSMIYVSQAHMAGVIVGTCVPIVFPSRSDDHHTKMSSIYMALAASHTSL